VFERRTIAGDVVLPFLTDGYEGFDINDPYDWMVAERLLADGAVSLPPVTTLAYEKRVNSQLPTSNSQAPIEA
jgi:N-acylneuraminate cytidylyltransferase